MESDRKKRRILVAACYGTMALNLCVFLHFYKDPSMARLTLGLAAVFALMVPISLLDHRREMDSKFSLYAAIAANVFVSAFAIVGTGTGWLLLLPAAQTLGFFMAAYGKPRRKPANGSVQVRKMPAERWTMEIFFSAAAVLMLIFSVRVGGPMWIMCALCFAVAAAIIGYYESWQITLDSKGIRKRIFFRTDYTWSQISKVEEGWSYTRRAFIRIRLRNGKELSFRLADAQGSNARKLICKHTSIQQIAN